MKPHPSWACFTLAEGTGHGLQEAEACQEEGEGGLVSQLLAVRWAVGNTSRQAHPAGAKGFPTKPFHSRDARQKVQGVKHGQGSLNISQSVCKESQISGAVMKVPRSKEGVKGTFGTA